MESKSLKKSTKKRKKELKHSDSSQPKSKKQRIDDDQLIANKMKEVAANEKKCDVKSKKKIIDDDQLNTFKKMKEIKGNDFPGQKHDTPGERDPLRIFFEALYQQLPDNEIAAVWMMEWGLLSPDEAIKVYKKVSSPVKEIAANKSSDVAANQMNETVTKNMSKVKKRKVKVHKLDNQSRLAPVKRKKHKASS